MKGILKVTGDLKWMSNHDKDKDIERQIKRERKKYKGGTEEERTQVRIRGYSETV